MAGGKKLRVAMVGQKTILSRKGGVEVVVKELSERMVKQGITVTCYNRREKGEERPKNYNGIRMKYAWTIKAKGLAALTSSFFATIMILFSKNDVVHYHAEGPCAWMWIIKIFSKKRIIATIHGLDWRQPKWGRIASYWIRKGEKTAVKYADEIISLNSEMRNYFLEKYNRETVLIPNGVSFRERIPVNSIGKQYGLKKGEYILYLGRIIPSKGIDCLINAYEKVGPNKKLVIAGGPNDDKKYYSEIVKKTQDNKNIVLTGFVDGDILDELYSNAFLYVFPSEHEGMPLSLLEAMSYGNCCLVSDIKECLDVIKGNGVTFKKSDEDDLGKSLLELCDNNEKVSRYKEKAKEYVAKNYCWNKVVTSTINIYNRDYCGHDE